MDRKIFKLFRDDKLKIIITDPEKGKESEGKNISTENESNSLLYSMNDFQRMQAGDCELKVFVRNN